MRLVEIKHIDDEQLDETHPMTRMMLKAMGDKDPEKTVADAKRNSKNNKKGKFFKKKKVNEADEKASDDEEDKCRGCGTTEPGARINGLCKECAEDTYVDRD